MSSPGTDPEPAPVPDAESGSPCVTAADPPPVKVDITVAGHTVIVEAHRPMEDVADLALHLIGRTAGYARRIPAGFDTSPADTQLADVDPSAVTAHRTPTTGAAG